MLLAFLARFLRAAANEEPVLSEAVLQAVFEATEAAAAVGDIVEDAAEEMGGGGVGVGHLIDDRGDWARDVTLFVWATPGFELGTKSPAENSRKIYIHPCTQDFQVWNWIVEK